MAACTTATVTGAGAVPALSTTAPPPLPIVFVHGNGDTAALWTTTLWRFESNGWPRDRLHAVHLPDPLARDEDHVPQPGRSSTADSALALAAEVDAVLRRTGANKVVLVGNSRGGYAIRNYVQNFGGAAKVERAVLGGTPNHGVRADASDKPDNEFNGAGPFLTALNAPKGANGDEATPGVAWMTLRSDDNDKYAQPDGAWIGMRGRPTSVGFDGPALRGATNVVLPRRDHREVSFHPQAFAKTYAFITGSEPQTTAVVAEPNPVLGGQISGQGPAGPDNRPLAGASIAVYAVDAATGARLPTPACRPAAVAATGAAQSAAAANPAAAAGSAVATAATAATVATVATAATGATPSTTAAPSPRSAPAPVNLALRQDPDCGRIFQQQIGADGRWGPFTTERTAFLEFVIQAPGYATTHVYRSPFPRSSSIVNFRAERLAAGDRGAAAVLTLTRPRGYFGIPRDSVVFDGISPPPGVPAGGVAGVSSSKLVLRERAGRSVVATFDSGPLHERLAAIAWPAADNHVVLLELHD